MRGYISILEKFKDIGPYHTEKIYYNIAKMIDFNIIYFRGIISGIGYLLFFYYLKSKEINYRILFMLLFLVGFSFESLNVIRMFLASMFFLNAVDNWNKKKIKASILFFLAIIFHKSYLFTNFIFLFCLLVQKIKGKKKILFVVVLITCLVCILGIFLKNTDFSQVIIEKIGINSSYSEENIQYEGMVVWQITTFFRKILQNLMYLLLLLFIMNAKRIEKEEIFSIISILIYFLMVSIFKNSFISNRIIANSMPIIFIAYAKIILESKFKIKFIVLIILMLIYFICNNIMMIRYLSWNIVTKM